MAQILIIDDEPQIRSMLRQMLEREGYSVLDAANGREALRHLAQNPVDLVITDLIMPDMEGIETIRNLKQAHPGIDIIAISGGGRIGPDTYLELARKLGARFTFTKPIGRSELVTAVRSILD